MVVDTIQYLVSIKTVHIFINVSLSILIVKVSNNLYYLAKLLLFLSGISFPKNFMRLKIFEGCSFSTCLSVYRLIA